ncbi:MAG: hypothetical protein U0163_07690 [Gemmatimonadaceae bacterium]
MMRTWLRRIRGAIGTGITWAATWGVAGFVPRWVFGIEGDLPFPILFAGLGMIAGVTFSAILMLADGRRRLDQMSLGRFAAWGAIGGLLLSVLFVTGASYSVGAVLAIAGTFSAASAVCAAGSLAVARRAERQALTDGGAEVLHKRIR